MEDATKKEHEAQELEKLVFQSENDISQNWWIILDIRQSKLRPSLDLNLLFLILISTYIDIKLIFSQQLLVLGQRKDETFAKRLEEEKRVTEMERWISEYRREIGNTWLKKYTLMFNILFSSQTTALVPPGTCALRKSAWTWRLMIGWTRRRGWRERPGSVTRRLRGRRWRPGPGLAGEWRHQVDNTNVYLNTEFPILKLNRIKSTVLK